MPVTIRLSAKAAALVKEMLAVMTMDEGGLFEDIEPDEVEGQCEILAVKEWLDHVVEAGLTDQESEFDSPEEGIAKRAAQLVRDFNEGNVFTDPE